MLVEKVRKTIKENNLIKNGEYIVTGLSGGPDSVCLFHVLMSLQEEMDLKLYPVHINHKFRPGAAERDQAYVENLCEVNGIKCSTFVTDCGKLAKELGMTDEEAGRKVRYDAFRQIAQRIASGEATGTPVPPEHIKIAVAQNANDQAETILFRLLRGTGPDGLAGISYSRSEGPYQVIRPILDIYRSEIEEYCRRNELNPVIDHTNSETLYARNRIRLQLLPHLQQNYNSNIMAALNRLGRIAGEDKDYLWQQTENLYEQALLMQNETSVTLDLTKVRESHKAVRHRLLMKALAATGLSQDITEERLAASDRVIDDENSTGMKRIQLPYGYEIKISYGKIICGRSKAAASEYETKHTSEPSGSEDRTADPGSRRATAAAADPADSNKPELHAEITDDQEKIKSYIEILHAGKKISGAAVFDADKLQQDPLEILRTITIRHRREGDYIYLAAGRRKIRKLMIDMKIPADERDSIWLAAAGNEVLYMAGSRHAERYRPDSSTRRLLILNLR